MVSHVKVTWRSRHQDAEGDHECHHYHQQHTGGNWKRSSMFSAPKVWNILGDIAMITWGHRKNTRKVTEYTLKVPQRTSSSERPCGCSLGKQCSFRDLLCDFNEDYDESEQAKRSWGRDGMEQRPRSGMIMKRDGEAVKRYLRKGAINVGRVVRITPVGSGFWKVYQQSLYLLLPAIESLL